MGVSGDIVVFPHVARPIMAPLERCEEVATIIGAAEYGAKWLAAQYVVVLGDHVSTHVDSLKQMRQDATGSDRIPPEYCYDDGVVLDFIDRPVGYGITAEDCQVELDRIGHTLKPLGIMLIKAGVGRYNTEMRYLREHRGMKVSVFPIKWESTTAAPVWTVAILDQVHRDGRKKRNYEQSPSCCQDAVPGMPL
jgi:hypothetical protein